MRRRTQRLWLIGGGLGVLGLATALILSSLTDNLVFFYAPGDLANKVIKPGQIIRLGGLVEAGSLTREGAEVTFKVTDTKDAILVRYRGQLPDLFREGQGVVTQGKFDPQGGFQAIEVLAKHDETYMPREVADALKARGVWKEGAKP